MLKRLDVTGVLVAGGFLLSSIAYRYGWTETTLFVVGIATVCVVTYAQRRFAKNQ